MIGSVDSYGGAQSLGQMGSPSGMQGPPKGPPPAEKQVDKLESAVESGEVDTDELASKLLDAFGDDAEGIVSESGEVDYDALTSLIGEARAEKASSQLTEKFDEGAAAFVSETGDIDHDGLKSYLDENGFEKPQGPPPQGLGGQQTTGYGAQGQTTTQQSALSFLNVFA